MENRTKALEELVNETIRSIAEKNLSNEDSAAVLTVVMQNLIAQKHNQTKLLELGINIENLSIDAVCEIQKIWTKEYYKKLKGKNE